MKIRLHTAVAVVAFLLAVAGGGACSSEHAGGPVASPSTPRLDGGVTFGSGGRSSSSGTENTVAADSGSMAARGGVGFGSGS